MRQLCLFPTHTCTLRHTRSPQIVQLYSSHIIYIYSLAGEGRGGRTSHMHASVQQNWHARRAYCHSARRHCEIVYRPVTKGSRKNEWKCISSARYLFIRTRRPYGEFQLRPGTPPPLRERERADDVDESFRRARVILLHCIAAQWYSSAFGVRVYVKEKVWRRLLQWMGCKEVKMV